jgi:hypothetical protein
MSAYFGFSISSAASDSMNLGDKELQTELRERIFPGPITRQVKVEGIVCMIHGWAGRFPRGGRWYLTMKVLEIPSIFWHLKELKQVQVT